MNIDDQMRDLDPARNHPVDMGPDSQAMATLHRIVSSTTSSAAHSTAPAAVTKPKRRVRYVLAAAATGIVAIAAPVLGGADTAYAGWNPNARPATAQEKMFWGGACRDQLKDDTFRGITHEFVTKLTEIRGPWAFSLVTAPDGYSAMCLGKGTVDSPEPGQFGSYDFIEGIPASDGILTSDAALGRDNTNMAAGKVGSDVTAITIDDHGTKIQATVQDGWFAAWWPEVKPSSLLESALERGTYPDIILTLRDGSTRTTSFKDFDHS